MQVYGGLDIGTNGVRLVVVDDLLKILYQNEMNYETNSPLLGWAEQDSTEIFGAVFSLLEDAVKHFSDDSLYITFSSVMHSIMGVDSKGNCLTPLIIWADTRARVECKELKEIYGTENFYKKTGCPIHSAYWPAKIKWLKKNRNDYIDRYVSIKEYILFKLTGIWKADKAIASTSGIYNPIVENYDESILEALGINRNNLSELVSTTYQFDFKVKGKIIHGLIGSTDGPLANLGSGAISENSIVLTAGSSSAVRFISKELIFDKKAKVWNYVLDEDYYVLGEATNAAGLLLNWLADIFNYNNPADMIFENLTELPYKITNLISIPTMMGERGPGYNEEIRGLFYGLSMNHSRRDLIIALYESIVFYLKMVFDDVQRVIKNKRDYLLITGGLGISPIFRKLLSYLLDDINYLPDYVQSTALGSAMLAFKEIKKISYEEQLKLLPKPSPVLVDKDGKFEADLLEKYDRFLYIYNNLSKMADNEV